MKELKSPLNWMLLFVLAAVAMRYWPGAEHGVGLFVCAGLGIIPLAGLLGRATEELGSKFGQNIGGLLNATFGNAAELIIALIALSKGMTEIVKASITGSILGNLLLVLGAAFIVGGTKTPRQHFNKASVKVSTTSLMLAAFGLLIPTIFHLTAAARPGGWSPEVEQKLSLAIAIVLVTTYICTLLFSLKTHRDYLSAIDPETETHSPNGWSVRTSLIVITVSSALVALMSEYLIGSIEKTREQFGFTETFVGVIIVAVVGNAAEHFTAIVVARKNKMDLSIGIAAGSSLQIAVFVAPILVFASYGFGSPMNLEFTIPEIVAVIASTYIVAEISGDGESNWLEGVQLVALYLIIAVLFFFLPAT